MQLPEIRYATSGDVAIAYAVSGTGPVDLVYVHGFAGNLEAEFESPHYRAPACTPASARSSTKNSEALP